MSVWYAGPDFAPGLMVELDAPPAPAALSQDVGRSRLEPRPDLCLTYGHVFVTGSDRCTNCDVPAVTLERALLWLAAELGVTP